MRRLCPHVNIKLGVNLPWLIWPTKLYEKNINIWFRMRIKNVNKHMDSFHLLLKSPWLRMTVQKKLGDASSVHKLLNKQSQEGYNMFLRLHCKLIWISPVDIVSGLARDRGITLIADVMLSHGHQDQTSDEEWPGLVPSSQAILIQWLASLPSLCCPLLLTKKRGRVPTWCCVERVNFIV